MYEDIWVANHRVHEEGWGKNSSKSRLPAQNDWDDGTSKIQTKAPTIHICQCNHLLHHSRVVIIEVGIHNAPGERLNTHGVEHGKGTVCYLSKYQTVLLQFMARHPTVHR